MFWKELKKGALSIPFLLLFFTMLIVYQSQLSGYLDEGRKITEPQPGLESYGIVHTDDPALVMPGALNSLGSEFADNRYVTYPWGFLRNVRLGEAEQDKMAELLSRLSGKPKEEIIAAANRGELGGEVMVTMGPDGSAFAEPHNPDQGISPAKGLSYEKFRELMNQADALLGGGSDYQEENLSAFAYRGKTYEEAKKEYEDARDIDRFTGAHARLFSDYMTIFCAFLPAFLMVSEALRDRRARIQDLIWTRKISSLRLTLTRYGAAALLSISPVLLLAGVDTVRSTLLYAGEQIDLLAYPAYVLGWIMPTVLFSCGLGLFFTELTDTPVGLAAVLAFWFLDLNRGMRQIHGGYENLTLMPRHNSLMGAATLQSNFEALLANRLFYTAAALVLVGVSALILEQKRKGGWKGYDALKELFAHRRGLPEE